MPKQPPWTITVGRKAEVISEFVVPAHKLQRTALENYLRALVVRYRTKSPEDMLNYYVNRTKGKPTRLVYAELRPYWSFDLRRSGYFCGEWECYASATYEVSAEIAQAVQNELERGKQANFKNGDS